MKDEHDMLMLGFKIRGCEGVCVYTPPLDTTEYTTAQVDDYLWSMHE